MAYLEEISLRSSETLRQWFKKLQCIIPGNFSKNSLKPTMTKLLQLNANIIGDDVFPSQKNLDVIMNTLRRDLLNLLRKSENTTLITLLIYKLNILDNNIREICRFQHAWLNHPLSNIESLKVQEKYIIRLIEEIMDDIFDAYSSIRRRIHHFSFNERNINGIISVLGILKREVCNMIHVIIASIEQHHKSNYYETICTPPAIAGQNLVPIDVRKPGTLLPITSSAETKTIANEQINKCSQASLPANRSYPFIERTNGRIFSSLQNICSGLSVIRSKSKPGDPSKMETEDDTKDNYDVPALSKNYFFNVNKTNGRGDADKILNDQSEINFNLMESSEKRSYEQEDSPGISKNVNTYFAYAEKNKSSLLSYNRDLSRSRNVSRRSSYLEQDDYSPYLSERSSRLSWPSPTVVRDIKSEMHLDGSLKFDRSGRTDSYKDFYSTDDDSTKDDLSESDSDESYISCALDEFQLDANFLHHIKETYLQEDTYKKTFGSCAERNDTKNFSCKSPKLSEIFSGPRIITRKEGRVAEIYHSVESLPNVAACLEEMSTSQLSRETKSFDVASSTSNETDFKPLQCKKNSWDGYGFGKREPLKLHGTLIDSFNTLALSEDYGGNDARYSESIISFASVATETADLPHKVDDKHKDNQSLSNCKPLQQQQGFQRRVDVSPNLEDSQFSAMCLALPPSNIRLVNFGNENQDDRVHKQHRLRP